MSNVSKLQKLVQELGEEKPEIKVFKKKGRGRKQCPECQRFIGVRHKFCICKHVFQKKPEPVLEIDSPEYVEARSLVSALGYNHLGFRILFIPSGKCPVKFKGDVGKWADQVIERYYGEGYILAPSALRYMLNNFSPMNSESYVKNKQALEEWISKIKGE